MYDVQIPLNPKGATAGGTLNTYFRAASGTPFAGYISGTTLTVTTMYLPLPGTITIGMGITGTGVTIGTYIVSQTSGTTGGAGVYVVSASQTVGSAGTPVNMCNTGGLAFVATVSATTLTVSSVISGTIPVGRTDFFVFGQDGSSVWATTSATASYYISAAGTGTGGTGTYTISATSNTIATATVMVLVCYQQHTSNYGPGITNAWQNVYGTSLASAPSLNDEIVTAGHFISGQSYTIITIGNTDYTAIGATATATFTGYISGNTLTVATLASGSLGIGFYITGTGILSNTYITAFVSGTGGLGTYSLNNSQTVASSGSPITIILQPLPGTAFTATSTPYSLNQNFIRNNVTTPTTVQYTAGANNYGLGGSFGAGLYTIGSGTGTAFRTVSRYLPAPFANNSAARFVLQWTTAANLTSAASLDNIGFINLNNGYNFVFDFETSNTVADAFITSTATNITLSQNSLPGGGILSVPTTGSGRWVLISGSSTQTSTGAITASYTTSSGSLGAYVIVFTASPALVYPGQIISGATGQGTSPVVIGAFSSINTVTATATTGGAVNFTTVTASSGSPFLYYGTSPTTGYPCVNMSVTGTNIAANTVVTAVYPNIGMMVINNVTTGAIASGTVAVGANAFITSVPSATFVGLNTGSPSTNSYFIGASVSGTNVPANAIILYSYQLSSTNTSRVYIINQTFSSAPTGTITISTVANSVSLSVANISAITATVTATFSAAMSGNNYLISYYGTNSSNLWLHSPEIMLYNNPFNYTKDPNGIINLPDISIVDNYSVSFNGSNQYLSMPYVASHALGSNNFVIEAWIYPTSSSIMGIASTWVTGGQFNFTKLASNYLEFGYTNAASGTSSTTITGTSRLVTVNAWNHVAVVRSGTTIRLFVNGVADATTGTGTGTIYYYNGATKPFNIGVGGDIGNPFAGYISNFRFINGSVPTDYVSTGFTPQYILTTGSGGATATDVKMLVCRSSSATVDLSSVGNVITNNNTATVSSSTVPLPVISRQLVTYPWATGNGTSTTSTPTFYLASGNLPSGLSLSTSGLINGTLASSASFNEGVTQHVFSVQVFYYVPTTPIQGPVPTSFIQTFSMNVIDTILSTNIANNNLDLVSATVVYSDPIGRNNIPPVTQQSIQVNHTTGLADATIRPSTIDKLQTPVIVIG